MSLAVTLVENNDMNTTHQPPAAPQLSWKAKDALKAIRNFNPRPGTSLGPQNIMAAGLKQGSLSPSDLMDGVEELAKHGIVDLPDGANSTSIIVTEAGYNGYLS